MTTTQSVVVPVEPTEAMMKAADAVDWSNEDERASVINMWQSMLAAAPAPSSLSGGVIERVQARAEALERIGASQDAADLRAILAALSPEAPARVGVAKAQEIASGAAETFQRLMVSTKFDRETRELWAGAYNDMVAIYSALTPRHEAPAERAGEQLVVAALHDADCVSDRIHAGGYRANLSDVECLRNHVRKLSTALRARSSAPEAREGLKAQVRPMEDTLSAFEVMKDHFVGASSRPVKSSAPSADKLRIAVEALEPFARLELPRKSVGNAGFYSLLHSDIRRAAQALAALQAEQGAK